MSFDPGAMAAPIKAMVIPAISKDFLAWKTSEADARIGENTACVSDKELTIQVCVLVPPRSDER